MLQQKEQENWWSSELNPFSFYLATFTDPLDREKAQKRINNILTQYKTIENAVQFIIKDMQISQNIERKYSTFYSDGRTCIDQYTGKWKKYVSGSANQTQNKEETKKQEPNDFYKYK